MRAFTMGQKKSNEFENIRSTLFNEEEFSEYSYSKNEKPMDAKSKVKFEESQLETASKFEVSIHTKQPDAVVDAVTMKSAGKKSTTSKHKKKKVERSSVKVRKQIRHAYLFQNKDNAGKKPTQTAFLNYIKKSTSLEGTKSHSSRGNSIDQRSKQQHLSHIKALETKLSLP